MSHQESKYFRWLSSKPTSICATVPRKVMSSRKLSTVMASPNELKKAKTWPGRLVGLAGMERITYGE